MSLPPDTTAVPTGVLPEAETRTLLRVHPAEDGPEAWLAGQPWHAAVDGSWLVERDREGWTCRAKGVPGSAVRIVPHAPGSVSVTSWLFAPKAPQSCEPSVRRPRPLRSGMWKPQTTR